jgi:hypothetical protein
MKGFGVLPKNKKKRRRKETKRDARSLVLRARRS